jgi:hypothetical protein
MMQVMPVLPVIPCDRLMCLHAELLNPERALFISAAASWRLNVPAGSPSSFNFRRAHWLCKRRHGVLDTPSGRSLNRFRTVRNPWVYEIKPPSEPPMSNSLLPRGLAAVASFVITLLLFQGVASLAAPSSAPGVHLAKVTPASVSR